MPALVNGADVQIGDTVQGDAPVHVPGGTTGKASSVPVVPSWSLDLTSQTTPVLGLVPSEVTTGEPDV